MHLHSALRPRIADVVLVLQVYNVRRFRVDMTPFPVVRRVVADAERHPAFVAARPDAQPDFPGDS